MKPTDFLKEDHSRVERLFKKVEETPPSEHTALFKQIKAELDVHAHIEETEFYPVLLKRGKKDLKDITREGIEEHGQAKLFLADLASMTRVNKQYEPKLKVLMEDIRHHVKEEENEMFPMVEDQFTQAAMEKMTAAMEAEKASFIATMTPAEQKALKASITGAENDKGTMGKMYDKAKEMVAGMFNAGDGAKKPARASAPKTNGKNRKGSGPARAMAAKHADSSAMMPETSAEKRRAKVDQGLRKAHVARAQK